MFGALFFLACLMRTSLEREAIEGESPVAEGKRNVGISRVLSIGYLAGMRETSTSNPKYVLRLIEHSTVREC